MTIASSKFSIILLIINILFIGIGVSQDNKLAKNIINDEEKRSPFKKKLALLIGIPYSGELYLEYTVNDVRVLSEVLGNFGFKIISYTENGNTTKQEILEAFEELKKQVTDENDQIIIFFSGHGQKSLSSNEVGYLIPSDGIKDNLLSTCISMTTLQDLSKELKANQVLFLIDACYSGIIGGFSPMGPIYPDSKSNVNINLIDALNRRGRQVITAGRSNETVYLDPEKEMSIFTLFLREGLTKDGELYRADKTKDYLISSKELFSYICEKVTLNYSNKQHPGYYDYGNSDCEFIFITKEYQPEVQTIIPDTSEGIKQPIITELTAEEITDITGIITSHDQYYVKCRSLLGRIVNLMHGNEERAIASLLLFIENDNVELETRVEAAYILTFSYEAIEYNRNRIVEFLNKHIDKVDPYLLRQNIIRKFGSLQAYETIDKLIFLLQYDDNNEVRREAIETLKKLYNNSNEKENIENALIYATKYDDVSSVRQTAIRTIGDLGLINPKYELINLLKSPIPEEYERQEIVRTLGKLRAEEAVIPLVQIIESPNYLPYLVQVAVHSLILIDNPQSIIPLRNLFTRLTDISPDPTIRSEINEYFIRKNIQ